MFNRLFCCLIFLSVALGALAQPAHSKPNIVIFLADDMGYSDLGCYGGEIHTPNLDRLAKDGLRFTQFYNTARCWPSRAAILTGYYAQQVRRDTPPGVPQGGGGVRPTWARLIPDFLKPLGYRSYHSGKWHVDGLSVAGGFDHSYRIEDHDRHFNPQLHFEDDKQLPPVMPNSGYYSATAIADHAIKCLAEHAETHADSPFFSYVAFISPHFPLMAPPEDIAKYNNRFRKGWDTLREERLERMKRLGIVNCELSTRTPEVPAWNTLTKEERTMWQARMAVHAAMVDRMDAEIGRVIAQLKSMGTYDNTLILFLSDNGASAERLVRGDGNDPKAAPGSAKSFLCLEPGWANLSNTPLRKSKIFVHEGGISTPLIAHWTKGISAKGELRRNSAHLIDILPTIMEVAGSKKPETWEGQALPPAPGRSFASVFAKDDTLTHDYLWWFHADNRAIRVGEWKLVSTGLDGSWELYNLETDRSEMHNLAAIYPERAKEMERVWSEKMEAFRALANQPDAPIKTDKGTPR